MSKSDRYLVVEDSPQVEIKEKGSRFLGQAFFVENRKQVRSRLASIRKQEHSASHHCSAFQLAPGSAEERGFDDDGEPAGTAGAPILARIQGRRLFSTMVVVTRYFGGTKLGTGGLIRAYGETAGSALEAAGRREVVSTVRRILRSSWDDLGLLESALTRHQREGSILSIEREFGEAVLFRVDVARSRAEVVDRNLTDSLSGRLIIEQTKK